MPKLPWRGRVMSVQPRIRLTRSFDERQHSYLGYNLRIDGEVDGSSRDFIVAVGKAAQAKHEFRVGDDVSGASEPVADPRMETADLYKTAKLKVSARSEAIDGEPPPWLGPPSTLEVYRERGHRRLAARTYETSCRSCIWGANMAVEMIIDQWNPEKRRYRQETFCYGPKSCRLYKAGPTRKVPGRRGMSWTEEDWVDEDATAHRGEDE